MIQVTFPFAQFTDKSGLPLDAGFIYIGTENMNPETNPIAMFWDDALTIPAAQPLRTINGYIARNGSPGRVYTNTSAYSIMVRDKSLNLVATALDASALDSLRADLAAPSGSSLSGFAQAGIGAALRTVQDELRERVSAEQFFLAGEINSTWMLKRAIAAVGLAGGGKVELQATTYIITEELWDNGKTIILIGKGSNEDPNNSGNCTIIQTQGAINGWVMTGNRSGARDLTVKGDNGAYDGTIAGFKINGSKSSLENVSAINNRGHGFMYIYGNQSYFSNLLALDNRGHGLYIGDSIASVDDNASTFIHLDMRINSLSGVYIDSNISFSNNFYNLTTQGNGEWGFYCDSTYNNVYGMYEEGSGLGPIKFEVNSANNRIKGLLTATFPPLSDSSVSKKNWVEGYNGKDFFSNPTELEIGDKNGATPGFLTFKWDGTEWIMSLTANGTSPNLRCKSTGGGKLLFKADIEAPIAPALLNGWANFGGSRQVAGYHKDLYDKVHLQGSISNPGAPATPSAVMTLPVGYRPPARVSFPVHSGSTAGAGTVGFVFVDIDGNVYYDGGLLVEFSLDGISFRTT
jgi:hypothetical protein